MGPPYQGNIVDELNKKIDNSETPDLDSFFSLDLLPTVEAIPQENEVQERQGLQGMWSGPPAVDSFLSLEPFALGMNVPHEEVHERQETQTMLSETQGLNNIFSLDPLPADPNDPQDQGIQIIRDVRELHKEEISTEAQDRREIEEYITRNTVLNYVDKAETVPGPSAALHTGQVLDNILAEKKTMEEDDTREQGEGIADQISLVTIYNPETVEESSAPNAEMQTACTLNNTQDEERWMEELDRKQLQEKIAIQAALIKEHNSETEPGTSAAHAAIQTGTSEDNINEQSDTNKLTQTGNSKEDTINVTAVPAVIERFLPAVIETVVSEDGKIRFKCDLCEATFTLKRVLGHHRKILHKVGICLYTCGECEKRFRNQKELDSHIQKIHRVDREEKKWKCTKCSLSFAKNNTLKNHMRLIHGEQSGKFRCDVCHRECYDAFRLQEHIQAIHQNVEYTCSVCGQSYKYRRSLARHKKNKKH